jgi:hypothetical protein
MNHLFIEEKKVVFHGLVRRLVDEKEQTSTLPHSKVQ